MKHEIFGSVLGLKQSEIDHLEKLEQRRIPREQYVALDLAHELSALSVRLNRRIGLYVDRGGHVQRVILGTATSLEVPEPAATRAASGRLRGIRLIETVLDEVRANARHDISKNDLADLLHFRLDCLVEIRALGSGRCNTVRLAHLLPPNPEGKAYQESEDIRLERLPQDFDSATQALEEEFAAKAPRVREMKGKTRAMVVALLDQKGDGLEDSLAEISELARSADWAVVEKMPVRLRRIDPRSYLSKGKTEEVELRAVRADADVIVFDHELSPVQARNLEKDLRMRIVDRTALILDIFARRAQSTDGKLQVELARLKYEMPRVSDDRGQMSRIGGGGMVRGAGETRASLTRRKLRERIAELDQRIGDLSKRRAEQRKARERARTKVISLVGYTNAGKSTLFNALTGSKVLAQDLLFATLDPTARKVWLAEGLPYQAVLTDTVGFIRELPKELVNAFRATLEGLHEADLLVHVADASNPAVIEQIDAVARTLQELKLGDRPSLLLFNKADRISSEDFTPIAARHGGHLVSALDPADQQKIRGLIVDALAAGASRSPASDAGLDHDGSAR